MISNLYRKQAQAAMVLVWEDCNDLGAGTSDDAIWERMLCNLKR